MIFFFKGLNWVKLRLKEKEFVFMGCQKDKLYEVKVIYYTQVNEI